MANIKFVAEVIKVETMMDGSVRVKFGLPETAIPQMAMLAECQRQGIPLQIEAKEAKSDRKRQMEAEA